MAGEAVPRSWRFSMEVDRSNIIIFEESWDVLARNRKEAESVLRRLA